MQTHAPVKKSEAKILEIHPEPTLDEIWDLCVRNFLYDQKKYVDEIVALFDKIGITKESRIADVSAGGGFPAINLAKLGYRVDCFDGFADELFNKNAKKEGVSAECKKILWQKIPHIVRLESYDFIFCRGNSFIFAGGGWDKITPDIDMEKVTRDYTNTMKIFADILKDGGYMYIDKFKDSEQGHREKLATIKVGDHEEGLIFSSDRNQGDGFRRVYMERVVGKKTVSKESRITYDLSETELIEMAKSAGFSKINAINDFIGSEKHFDVWLTKKAKMI
ncbi:MAG: hypothetical protein WC858_05825 [Parcubacteria group bacterium]|jgi:SAM-dependent methyltransferase